MPFGNMGPWQILLILAVILLIFGAARLPALAKSLGQSARVFKSEMKQMKEEGKAEQTAADVPTAGPAAPSAPATPPAAETRPDSAEPRA